MQRPWKFRQVILYVLLVSSIYALFELHLKPMLWLNIGKFQLYGLSTYHLLFMLPFYILIAVLPARRGLSRDEMKKSKSLLLVVGTFLSSLLAEDTFYFAYSLTPIKAGMWTTQWGYTSLFGQVIPDWYIVYALGSFLAFSYAYSWRPKYLNQPWQYVSRTQLRLYMNSLTRFWK